MRILVQFNSTRTHVMIVSRKKCVDQYPALARDGLSFKIEPSLYLLGVTIQNDLIRNLHNNFLAKSASRRVGIFFNSKQLFTSSQRLLLYKAQVRPFLEYCLNI